MRQSQFRWYKYPSGQFRLATKRTSRRTTPLRREKVPHRPQAIDRWRGENDSLRTTKNPFLECPLLAQSGHWVD